MAIIATICARGGSKGLPGKNIRMFHGKPLIAHTIEHALACAEISSVYVSTDCEEIASIARGFGALTPYLRPAELATDSAGKLPVIEHLVDFLEQSGLYIRKIVDLQPTSPLRMRGDIRDALAQSDETGLTVSVCEPSHHPYFSLAEQNTEGLLSLSKPGQFVARQNVPTAWGLNGSIYVWQRHALKRAAQNGFWSVDCRPFVMPRSRSVDIDTLEDFELAEWLYSRNLNLLELP